MKAWLKGGLWGLLIAVIISITLSGYVYYNLSNFDIKEVDTDSAAQGILIVLGLAPFVIGGILIAGFILGSIIGLIIGKIKDKKTNPPLAVQQQERG